MLGDVNTAVADLADDVFLVIAGRVLPLGRLGVRRALAFLTPLGRAAVPDSRTMSWFPVVGALVGAVVGCVWWGADRLWPPAVAAALTVAADLALTGMLHVDGLADSADGLLPHLPRKRRLEVMADPAIGALRRHGDRGRVAHTVRGAGVDAALDLADRGSVVWLSHRDGGRLRVRCRTREPRAVSPR